MRDFGKLTVAAFGLVLMAGAPSLAQVDSPAPRNPVRAKKAVTTTPQAKDKLNSWTLGLAGGLLEGAPIRFATEMARIVDDGENMHVLPIVTRGPTENVEDLLYLKGVDVAIINSDSLEAFKTLVPDINKRITYILNLFPSELQIVAGPEIKTVQDLKGKKVNFNTPGTAAAYSGPLIFDKLGIEVEKTFIPHPAAMERMKPDDIAAVVFVTSKPVEALQRRNWPDGYHLLSVPYDDKLEYYLPSSLTNADYPKLVKAGETVDTIAVPTVLAAFNWPTRTDRYKRVERFTQYLFDRIDNLRKPGFHPKWADVNLSASVPGLSRFPTAQAWLDKANAPAAPTMSDIDPGVEVPAARARELIRSAAPNDRAKQEELFRTFMQWQRGRQ